jgi:hypothetical protein
MSKKPKAPKMPKKPKATASLETMKNYLKRVSEIKREFSKKMSEYTKAKKLHSKIKNL